MSDNCATCGLPDGFCACDSLARENNQLKIRVETRRFGKAVTVIDGLHLKPTGMKELTRALKSSCATGGTNRKTAIELQGDHRQRVVVKLRLLGFKRISCA
jgi:translation initiation factor 1